jgi:hypothetical protein
MQHLVGLFPTLAERLGRHLRIKKFPKMFNTKSRFARLITEGAFIAIAVKASNHINQNIFKKSKM